MVETKKEVPLFRLNENDGIYTAPGLVDLQVNGINGVDFNNPSLTKEEVLDATEYLLSRGVTTYFPTVITNSAKNIISLFNILAEACHSYPLVRSCVGGFHLEGPFISPKEGAKGAHDAQFICPPDWSLFEEFQKAADGNIKLITVAPEWEGSSVFIKNCGQNGVMVSMGHSMADTREIGEAVNAGLSFSTHLGNGVPLALKRHPNMLWDQLAEDRLTAMIITDGHHIPDSFIKVVLKAKGENVIIVSDTTRFAGMQPGEYETFIGGRVVLSAEKRLSLKENPGMLAGAAKDLLECVETLPTHGLTSLERAWDMASTRILDVLARHSSGFTSAKEDKIEFQFTDGKIEVKRVFKGEKMVFER